MGCSASVPREVRRSCAAGRKEALAARSSSQPGLMAVLIEIAWACKHD